MRSSNQSARWSTWGVRLLPSGIRERLFLLIALALLPVLILQGRIYYQHYTTRRSQALQTELEVAQGVATTFATYVDGVRQQLDIVGQAILAFTPYPEETMAQRLLKATVARYPTMRSVSWVSTEGSIRASSVAGIAGYDLSARPYFQQVAAGRPWAIGDITPQGAATPDPAVGIAVAVRDDRGTLQGVVVASVEPTRLGELPFMLPRYFGGTYLIFDRQGYLVYANPPAFMTWEERVMWRQTDPLLTEAQSGRVALGEITSSVAAGRQFAARMPIADTGWVAGTDRPVHLVTGPVRRALFWDVGLGLLVTTLAFVFAYLLAYTIAEPLRRLERDVGAIGSGAIETHADPEAPAEVSSLRGAVARMAADLIHRAESLRDREQELHLIMDALHKEKTISETTIESLPGIFYLFDAQGRFLKWNKNFERVSGYTTEELSSMHPLDFFRGDDRPLIERRIQEVFTEGESSAEAEFVSKDGRKIPYFFTGLSAVIDGSDCLIGTGMDITEHRRMQEELRQLNERLEEQVAVRSGQLTTASFQLQDEVTRRVFAEGTLRRHSQMLEAFFQHTITPLAFLDKDFNFLRVNEAYAKADSQKPDYFIGKDYFALYPDSESRVIFEQVVQTGQPYFAYARPFTYPNEPGRVAYRDWQLTPLLDEQGQVQSLVLNLEDVTEQQKAFRELEHRARQLQKLTLDVSEAESRERERLAEILHDDLQQVLAGAKFHLSLLRNRAKHDPSLQATAAQIDHMLKDAIDKSRSLSHDLSPAVLHHGDFAETLGWLAGQVQTKHGLLAHVEARGEIKSQSDALKGFLYKAAQEMLFNVVKHARVNEATIRVRRQGPYICLSVSDRGRGFDAQQIQDTHGFGLLSIRERVELLGGRMKIKSAKGKGSTFRIVVPDMSAAATSSARAEGALSSQRGGDNPDAGQPRADEPRLRVLLADDHQIVREGLASLLSEEHTIEVVGEAANGREAVDLAGRLQPDVVIMDVAMPLIDGDEATRQIKRHLPNTRIVALSMYEQPEMMNKMHEAGAAAYVLKTAPAEDLLAAIRGDEES